jgi:hypothetical protein
MILKLETYTEMGPRCLFRYFEVSFQSEKALYKQNYIKNPILFYLNMYDN